MRQLNDRESGADFIIVFSEILYVPRRLAISQGSPVLAQIQGVERVTMVRGRHCQLSIVEIVRPAVDIQHWVTFSRIVPNERCGERAFVIFAQTNGTALETIENIWHP